MSGDGPSPAITDDNAAKLNRLYRSVAADNAALMAHAEWLQQVVAVLHGKRRWWWWLLPAWLLRSLLLLRLKRRHLFNDKAYLSANPDVAKARLDPLRHYALNGFREGRSTGSNWINANVAYSPPPGRVIDDEGIVRRRVHETAMFDPIWYREQYASKSDDEADLLNEYFEAIESDVLRDPGPLFSTAYYLENNPDVRGVHPLWHFVEYGLAEGRRAFSPTKVNAFLAGAPLDALHPLTSFLNPALPTIVLHWKDGNFFFAEIAEYVAALLAIKGFPARCMTSDGGEVLSNFNVIVVAPHEYGVHGPGASWSPSQFAEAIYINTEQWHTSWFVLAYNVFRRSGKVLDVNPASAAGLARLGMRAGFVPLLPMPGTPLAFERTAIADTTLRLKVLKNLPYPGFFEERPYDIAFLGVLNGRRAEALAALAPTLAAYDCFLHAPRFDGPVRRDDPDMITSRDFAQIARNARILLNIHQGESHYFEWHRLFLSGIAQGCVVVTEPCTPLGILTEGVHYLAATLDEMPELIKVLLETEKGRGQMRLIEENCRKLMSEIDSGNGFSALW